MDANILAFPKLFGSDSLPAAVENFTKSFPDANRETDNGNTYTNFVMSVDLDKSAKIAKALPKRQKQVFVCLCNGLLAKETSEKLNITESTVRNTLTTVYQKLGGINSREAVRIAVRAGLVQ